MCDRCLDAGHAVNSETQDNQETEETLVKQPAENVLKENQSSEDSNLETNQPEEIEKNIEDDKSSEKDVKAAAEFDPDEEKSDKDCLEKSVKDI